MARYSIYTCPHSSHQVQLGILDMMYNTNAKNILQGGVKVNRVGPQDLRNDVMVNSFEFPFCLIYPRHGTEEAGNLETPIPALSV